MSLFNFSQEELMSFFAVLVRFSVLIAVLPIVGDRFVPAPLKVLLSLAITIALFPALVASGQVRPMEAATWGSTPGGIVGTIALEALFALVLGFIAKIAFDAISFGGNLVGNFMGFASASVYDPHQESQTQLVSELQMALATLIFLAVDGHHLMLRASLDSYRIVGIGGIGGFAARAAGGNGAFNAAFSTRLVQITGEVIKFGIQLAAPVAISLFAVNVAFGVLAKAMPQINILVLSFAVSAFVGLTVIFLSIPEFHGVVTNIFSRTGDWMESIMVAMAQGR